MTIFFTQDPGASKVGSKVWDKIKIPCLNKCTKYKVKCHQKITLTYAFESFDNVDVLSNSLDLKWTFGLYRYMKSTKGKYFLLSTISTLIAKTTK